MPSRRKFSYSITLGVIITGFLLLTLFVYLFPLSPLDIDFTRSVQQNHSVIFGQLMRAISIFGYSPWCILIVAATAAVFFFSRYRKESLFTLLTSLSGAVSSLLKIIVNRPRPSSNLVHIFVTTQDQSFPSGHVVFYVTFFGMLVLMLRNIQAFNRPVRITLIAILLLLIFTIPLSRIYLGAHWFTDVTAGFVVGLFCLSVLGYFYLFKRTASEE